MKRASAALAIVATLWLAIPTPCPADPFAEAARKKSSGDKAARDKTTPAPKNPVEDASEPAPAP